ncbi:MAG: phytoene/squalene synthase family protein [Deltaproteobacteria bacterium]|nr:phytoene/squalene synthase family protein [Deltaproteobacteria bacterium]
MTTSAELVLHGRETLIRHARSFRVASVFLPTASRDDAALVYAYCRELDDAVDEAPSLEAAKHRIALAERSEVASAYREVAARRGFDPGIAGHLVAGMRADLGAVRIADDRALLRYCYQVAGSVGLMMCGVLGVDDPRALPHAIDLGVAMQLTNICRDVLEDAGRDRVYLPASRLEAEGISKADLVAGRADPSRIARVVGELLALADSYYRSAEDGMPFIPARSRLAILVASRLYRGIGVRLRRKHAANPMHGRTRTNLFERCVGVLASVAVWIMMSMFVRPGRRSHRGALHIHLQGLPGASPG